VEAAEEGGCPAVLGVSCHVRTWRQALEQVGNKKNANRSAFGLAKG